MIDIAKHFAAQQIEPKGVIHVGAHHGEELALYRTMGFRRILLIEANPAVFRVLETVAAGAPGVVLANVAASDREGMVTLHVTSADQSSSILPLKKHRDLYPSIRETARVSVRAITVDLLLQELGLDPADFNYLHLDIQGAELLALQGARATLRHIEAINTEVNFDELYADCALFGPLEEFLGAHGFNRLDLACPYHPTWGDAFYAKRRLVTMSTLGRNGRFANQLFQYLYLRLVARQHGAIVHTPKWDGQFIFGLDDQLTSRVVPVLTEDELPHPESLFTGAAPLPGDVDFVGYFQIATAHLAPHRDFIRQLFTPRAEIRAGVAQILAAIRGEGRPLIALHLRRGDYGYNEFFRAPAAWYRKWLESVNELFPGAAIYVCSEDPAAVSPHFSAWNAVHFNLLAGLPPEFAPIVDFYVLAHADAVAISNSSYSFMACLLNERAQTFVRPCLEAHGLVPFDPWDAPVLLPRKLIAGEQPALDAEDEVAIPPALASFALAHS